jgi:hypothetical protein
MARVIISAKVVGWLVCGVPLGEAVFSGCCEIGWISI